MAIERNDAYEFFSAASAACLGVLQDSGQKRFLFFAFVEEIFDRFQFFGGNESGICEQLIHEKFFKLSLSFDYSFLFFSPGLNLFLQRPAGRLKASAAS